MIIPEVKRKSAAGVLSVLTLAGCTYDIEQDTAELPKNLQFTHIVQPGEVASVIVDKIAEGIPGEQPSGELSEAIGGISVGSIIDIWYNPNNNGFITTITHSSGNTRTFGVNGERYLP